MMAGLLLAAVLICSHVLKCEIAPPKSEKAKTEQDESKTDNSYSFVSAPTITPPSSAHIHQNLLAHCLFEIALPQSEEYAVVSDLRIRSEKLLLTLFRVIISPNAP